MGAWRLAFGPQLVFIALMGVGVAGCSSDSGRFSRSFLRGYRHVETTSPARSRGRQTASRASRCRILPAMEVRACRAAAVAWALISPQARQFRRHRLAAARGPTPAVLDLGRWYAGDACSRTRRSRCWRRHTACLSPSSWRPTTLKTPRMVHAGQHLVIPRYRGRLAPFRRRSRVLPRRCLRPSLCRTSAPQRALAPAAVLMSSPRRNAPQHRADVRQAGAGAGQSQ